MRTGTDVNVNEDDVKIVVKAKLKENDKKEVIRKLQVTLTDSEQKLLKKNAKKKGFGSAAAYAKFLIVQDGGLENN
jgi:hypothetical protein